MTNNKITLLETPRDAMQGIVNFIPTAKKVEYLNTLLQVGFDYLDFGSFVSPKVIPQLRDSAEVIEQLDTDHTQTKIVATIGNLRGAQLAFEHPKIDVVAFPFSISESFLRKNIKSDLAQSWETIQQILNLCHRYNKNLKVYIAMAFGNPYGDHWDTNLLLHCIYQLSQLGINDISLADTTGDGSAENIAHSYAEIGKTFPQLNIGVHLHTSPQSWLPKLSAAFDNGCRNFDSVIGGFGGCPMSGKALIGNLDTANLLSYLAEKGMPSNLNQNALYKAQTKASFLLADL